MITFWLNISKSWVQHCTTRKHYKLLWSSWKFCVRYIYKFFTSTSAPLTVNIQRYLYIDYFPPLISWINGLYIPNLEASENVDYNTFFAPFKANLWFTMIITTFVFAFIKLLIQYNYDTISMTNCVGCIWTSFISYLGGKPTKSPIDCKESYKTVIFTSLICGLVIWICYRAYLTAELSITEKSHPFTDMHSFSKTDWRYILNDLSFLLQ